MIFKKNKLTSLHEETFKNLNQLTHLYLQDNLLTRLPRGLLSNTNNLQFLHLDGNQVHSANFIDFLMDQKLNRETSE